MYMKAVQYEMWDDQREQNVMENVIKNISRNIFKYTNINRCTQKKKRRIVERCDIYLSVQ